jgi:crotonobetainyl-CoA:carnitine CoA-transferase CaiB-like acyl-CoA transferase
MGNQHPSIAPYEPFRCADRELVLAVGNDRQFAGLCEALEVPELAGDPRFATNGARVENRDALRIALEQRLATRRAHEWAAELTKRSVPAGVVNDIAGAFELARELGLDPVVTIARPDGSTVQLARNPIGLSATSPSYRSAPPRFGRDGGDAR